MKVPYIRYFTPLSVRVLQVVVMFFASNYALNYRTFGIFVVLCYRRRSHICSFFDYQYVGVSKDAGKEWNNRFILFVPFLFRLTSVLTLKLLEISSLESQQLLLFQKPRRASEGTMHWSLKLFPTVPLFGYACD